MLTPEQIDALRDAAGRLTDPVNEFLIDDIARRVSEAGQMTSTAAYQTWIAQQMGMSHRELKRELQKRLDVSGKELQVLLTQAAEAGYEFDLKRFPHVHGVPFAHNGALQQIVAAVVDKVQEDFANLTQTLGFIAPDGKSYPLTEAYQKTCGFAFGQVVTGAADYNTAMRRAVKNLADHGVRTVDYETGRPVSLEAAVRRNVMGGLGLLQEEIGRHNFKELGADGWEITAHANSAPDHEPVQGRQFKDEEFRKLNNSLKRRIGTMNCGHMAFPVVVSANTAQYTDEELAAFREENERGVTYEGRHYTGYEATQVQRKLEQSIRRQKRRVTASEATGDAQQLAVDKTRLTRLNQEYARFSKAAGLRTERERTWVHTAGRGGNKEDNLAAVFQTNEKYFRDDGTFDLEAAKADYKTFLQSVPEKNRMYLQQAMEGVEYQQTKGPDVVFAYSSKIDSVLYNPDDRIFKSYDFRIAFTHELGHRIDHTMFIESWNNEEFSTAIANARAVIDADPERFLGFAKSDADGFLSDIFSAICEDDYRFDVYHEKDYWLKQGNKEREIFANLFALETFGRDKQLSLLDKDFSNIMSIYRRFLE